MLADPLPQERNATTAAVAAALAILRHLSHKFTFAVRRCRYGTVAGGSHFHQRRDRRFGLVQLLRDESLLEVARDPARQCHASGRQRQWQPRSRWRKDEKNTRTPGRVRAPEVRRVGGETAHARL